MLLLSVGQAFCDIEYNFKLFIIQRIKYIDDVVDLGRIWIIRVKKVFWSDLKIFTSAPKDLRSTWK